MTHHPSAATLRDALGLVRVLYAREAARGADEPRLQAIARAGRQLDMATRFVGLEPGSLGHRAAPARAAEAFRLLSSVEWSAEFAALIEAARARVTGSE